MRTIINAILLSRNQLLMARRSTSRKRYAGMWSFPGGHVEPGERLEQALVREVREEIGVEISDYRFERQISVRGGGDLNADFHLYAVTGWTGEPSIQDTEHSELRWLSVAEAARLHPLALPQYPELLACLQMP
ncbi:MAG: NUDIX domain-containing protein [Pseudomonadota bacterium]